MGRLGPHSHPLGVQAHQVVEGEVEGLDGGSVMEAGVRPVPVVSVEPGGQLGGALFGALVGVCVGPFSENGLDEALGFSVGSGGEWTGVEVSDACLFASLVEEAGAVAAAIVGEEALHGDSEAMEEGEGVGEEGGGATGGFVGEDFGESEAGVVVVSGIGLA